MRHGVVERGVERVALLTERLKAQRAELGAQGVGDVLQTRRDRLPLPRTVHGIQHGKQRPKNVGDRDLPHGHAIPPHLLAVVVVLRLHALKFGRALLKKAPQRGIMFVAEQAALVRLDW